MKHSIIFIFAFFLTISAFAQSGEGILGGNIGLSASQQSDSYSNKVKNFNFYFNPQLAFRFSNTWQAGIGFGLGLNIWEFENNFSFPSSGNNQSYFFFPEVFIRKFFAVTPGFSPFIGASGNYQWFGRELSFSEDARYQKSLSTAIQLGSAFKISPSLQFFASYNFLTYSRQEDTNYVAIKLLPSQNGRINFGLFYVLKPGKMGE